jgi:hypothetical protein
MTKVYLLCHDYETSTSPDNGIIIGLFSTHELTSKAIEALSSKPGFANFKNGFTIDTYIVNEDHWRDGFGEET